MNNLQDFRKKLLKLTNQEILENGEQMIVQLSYQLQRLRKRNLDTKHQNYKIHHILYDPFTFVNAYSKISKNFGIREDDEIKNFFGITNAEIIANKFKTNRYKWKPTRRTCIKKPGKNKIQSIDTFTQQDRIAQEALRGILESIFESEFKEFEEQNNFICTNYGFRENLSTWDAVEVLKIQGQATNYAIEGDITEAYNNVNHDILLNLLRKRIKDEKFLQIMKELLQSGVMEENKIIDNIKGTPQGGVLSPLLFNIYMFELDKYVYKHIIKPILRENNSKKLKQNPTHTKLSYEIKKIINQMKVLRREKNLVKYKELKNTLNKKLKERSKNPSKVLSTLPSKAVYSRYADDWVLIITGRKKDAIKYKDMIKNFISEKLDMTLNENKTKITHITDGIHFLGYTIKMYSNKQKKTKKILFKSQTLTTRIKKITTSRKINIFPDKNRILLNVKLRKYCNNQYFPIAIPQWAIFTEFEIVIKFRKIALGLFNYYKQCDNYYILNRIFYILQYSCAKTLATRKRCSIAQIFKKYGKELKINRQIYQNEKIQNYTISFPLYTKLKNSALEHSKRGNLKDSDPFKVSQFWRTSLKIFLNCCICGSDENIAMHHINSLRKINPKKRQNYNYVMSSLNRKQIPVCKSCHDDITYGRYDGTKPLKLYNQLIKKL